MNNYVEFVSLPGSGKSTISIKVTHELNDKSINCINRTYDISKKNKFLRIIYKIFYATIFIALNPIFSFKILKRIIKTKQNSINDFITVTLNYYFVSGIIFCGKNNRRILILDQGILQAIWSINYSAQNKIEVVNFLREDLIPNYIIRLDCNRNILFSRLNERSGNESRVQSINSDWAIENLFKEYDLFIYELTELVYKKKIKYIILTNEVELDINNNIIKIVKVLEKNECIYNDGINNSNI